jgi:hypothetical protein
MILNERNYVVITNSMPREVQISLLDILEPVPRGSS